MGHERLRHGLFKPGGDPFRRDSIPAPPVRGEIQKILPGFLCDVRLFSGEILTDVPLPCGPVIGGYGKGLFHTFRVGQRVLVEFVDGDPSDPVVTASYALPGRSKGGRDLKQFQNNNPALFPQAQNGDSPDWELHHPSGYLLRATDQKFILCQGSTDVLTIDLQSKECTINTDRLKVKNGTVSVSDGDKLEQFLKDLVARVGAVFVALQNSPVTPLDGGASYKGGIASAVSANPLPQVPSDLNQTNTKISPA